MVASGERPLWAKLPALLADHLPGAIPRAMTRLTGGVSADVYRLDLDGPDSLPRSVVLRIHRENHFGHDAALEFAILKALETSDLPVAAPIGVDPAGDMLGWPCLLIDYVEGSTAIPEEEAARRIDGIANALARIHAVPLSGLPPLPARVDPLPELYDFLDDPSEAADWRARLSHLTNTRYTGPPALLHGDLWPENILWKDGEIAAILDWEDSAIGDPVSDVACTSLEIRYLFGRDGMERFRAAYATYAPIDETRFILWLAYVAAGGLKHMGGWDLPAKRLARMRIEATATLAEAAEALSA